MATHQSANKINVKRFDFFFFFCFFFGELSNSVHKQNQTTVADPGEGAGGPALPLLLVHQTEARRAKKNFFARPLPTPPPPPYLKVWIRYWTIYNTRTEKFLHVQMSTTNASKCYLPNTECFSSKWRQERNVMKLQVNRSHYEFYSEWIRTLYRRG